MPAEREPSLLLNVFQSVAERAPVVVELARERESCCTDKESPFADPRVTAS